MMGYLAAVRIRAARSTPSATDAGRPSMRQLGRSSAWWLKNQDLPSTQARLASTMWLSLTVISMSSHTQPQKVQVESSMTVVDGSAGLEPEDLICRYLSFPRVPQKPLLVGIPAPCVSPPTSRLERPP